MNPRHTRPLLLLALTLSGCVLPDDLAAPGVPGPDSGVVPSASTAPGVRPNASAQPGPTGGVVQAPVRATPRPQRADGRPTDGTVWIDDGADEWSVPADTYQVARATADRPDDLVGQQIHALYLVPKDGADNQHDTRGFIGLSMALMNRWFKGQTKGGQAFRFDTADDQPDVTFVRMDATIAELAASQERLDSLISEAVLDKGFEDRQKLYLVYYDGPVTAEMGTEYGLNSTFPIVFLKTFPDGGSQVTAQHELLHALGAVPACAPNSDGESHIKDGSHDQMHGPNYPAGYQEPGPEASPYDGPAQLDPGRDDYYGHGRTDCLDVARSLFLTPLAKDAAADYLRVPRPYPAGGVPLPAPALADTDLAIAGLRLVAGPAGSGMATVIGQVTARAGTGRRYVKISLDDAYDGYYLPISDGNMRDFAIEVPAIGAHEVVLQALTGLAYEDPSAARPALVRLVDGATAE